MSKNQNNMTTKTNTNMLSLYAAGARAARANAADQTFTIANISGGNERTFRLRDGALPAGALKHARSINCHGEPWFCGPAGEEARRLFCVADEKEGG